ncbi:MAG: RHS repeat-associated core domain-containing protein, partial [Candidatus Rokuibacteriota bacterium]
DDPSCLYYYRARYYSPPPGFPNAFQFTGRESEGLGGLHYYRARYYHPGFHRFISEDPIGFQGGDANLYAYVGNAPTNATDPKGLSDGRPDSSRGCRGDCL